MIESNEKLSQTRQCQLLSLARSTFYYQPQSLDNEKLTLLRKLDEQYLKTLQYGARSYATWFVRQGISIGRRRTANMMKILGIVSTAPKPKTSNPDKRHKTYPYLLKGVVINRSNQVWTADITYAPMEKGFGYLVAIMDWHSRKVLSWRLSNTLDADFCIQALEAAIQDYGCPEIFNTDQGAQFTAEAWICILKNHGNKFAPRALHLSPRQDHGESQVQISRDGKGRYHDNIFIERLWRTVKYELLYTRAFSNLKEVRQNLTQWFDWYNQERFHQNLDNQTPNEVYWQYTTIHQAA
ncbi:MAG: IS3 family transposase [Nitrosomonas sp.]